MNKNEKFTELINLGYQSKGESITLGGAILDREPINNAHVKSPLISIIKTGIPNEDSCSDKT